MSSPHQRPWALCCQRWEASKQGKASIFCALHVKPAKKKNFNYPPRWYGVLLLRGLLLGWSLVDSSLAIQVLLISTATWMIKFSQISDVIYNHEVGIFPKIFTRPNNHQTYLENLLSIMWGICWVLCGCCYFSCLSDKIESKVTQHSREVKQSINRQPWILKKKKLKYNIILSWVITNATYCLIFCNPILSKANLFQTKWSQQKFVLMIKKIETWSLLNTWLVYVIQSRGGNL